MTRLYVVAALALVALLVIVPAAVAGTKCCW